MYKEGWIDVAAAAERHHCSTKTIWRRIKQGGLPACTEKVRGRDGRPVIKTMIRVADLDDAFGHTAHDAHVRKVREAVPPLTAEQVTVIGKVLMDHLRDRDAKLRSSGRAGPSMYRRPGQLGATEVLPFDRTSAAWRAPSPFDRALPS